MTFHLHEKRKTKNENPEGKERSNLISSSDINKKYSIAADGSVLNNKESLQQRHKERETRTERKGGSPSQDAVVL